MYYKCLLHDCLPLEKVSHVLQSAWNFFLQSQCMLCVCNKLVIFYQLTTWWSFTCNSSYIVGFLLFDIGYHIMIYKFLSKCGLLLLYVWFVCDRYRLHIIDLDPSSVTSGGWLEDTSLVEKYTISDEAYNKLDGIAWTKYCHVLQLLYYMCMRLYTFHISSHLLGTFRKFKEKLASQNPTMFESKVSFCSFFYFIKSQDNGL